MRPWFSRGATAVVLAAAAAVPATLHHPIATKAADAHAATAGIAAADPADRALYDRLSLQVMALYDESRGGFVRRDGTPCEAAIELGLARGAEGDSLALEHALHTLRWMHGLLDTVGGGYFEGERDADHQSTSFEKRTDSNLRRLGILARVASRPGETFARDGRRVVDYAQRLLVDGRGGFANGQMGSRDLEPATNGVALRGWWRWAVHTGDPRLRDFALRSEDRLWNHCRDLEQGLVRRDTWGKVRTPSLLADQVEMGLAYLHGWEAAGRDSDLVRAKAIAAHVREHFEDSGKKGGGFRDDYSRERFGHSRRSGRPFEENAVAARFYAELGAATRDTSYTNMARRTWAGFDKSFEKPKLEAAEWALAIRATWAGPALERGQWGGKEGK